MLHAAGSVPSSGPVVLLVEDDEAFRQLTSDSLKARLGTGEVLEASTMAEAKVTAGARKVDVLVTDVILPDGSGFELIDSMARSHDVYVIVYSNYTADELRAGLDQHRIDQFVSKESGLRGLVKAVQAGLSAREFKG